MTQIRLSTVIVILSGALFVLATTLYLRGPSPVPSPETTAELGHEDHDHAADGEMVIELLREPVAVPEFKVTDLDGKTHTSSDWRGKVVLVNFWATWCPPCLAEIPALVELQEKYRDELLIVGISEDQADVDFVKTFGAERNINYPLVMSTPELQELFPGILALPTTFVFDPEGLMVKRHVGMLHAGETEALTRALSGMPVEARIVRVDDPGQFSDESAAQITEIPGVDLSAFDPARRVEVVQALNAEKCTCGCDLSVAKCRVDDPFCEVSLPVAEKIVERFK
ncbi:MAG: TlpA family protein disulfide reductase [Vicinamibacterales bacterium]